MHAVVQGHIQRRSAVTPGLLHVRRNAVELAKEFLLLPRTGHDPNPPMMDAQRKLLTRIRAAALANDVHWNTQGVR
ncbi:hypothetical protein EYC55_05530 [Xanthomonas oryzae]|nr:hypothetical protein EYC55_05530 [Xanthomonas oryzae]